MTKSVLITGVAGMIGSNLADWIIKNTDYKVIGIDDLSGGYIENIHPSVKFYLRDCNSPLDDIFQEHNIEYVYHFAAYAAEGLSPFIRKFNYTNNLVMTANIVNHCINYDVKRLIFTSSIAVYGRQEVPYLEEQVPFPIDPYGVAKYACELDIRIAGEQHGLEWCIIRPHNVYGPKQNIFDKYRNVLGIWMRQYLNGEPLTIFGDGTQTRAFSYINDCLEPLWNCAILDSARNEVFNLGSDKAFRINTAANTLLRIMGDGEIEYHEARHEVKYAYSDHSKSKRIGYEDKTTLQSGLKQMWDWAQKQEPKEIKTWKNLEISKDFINLWKK